MLAAGCKIYNAVRLSFLIFFLGSSNGLLISGRMLCVCVCVCVCVCGLINRSNCAAICHDPDDTARPGYLHDLPW